MFEVNTEQIAAEVEQLTAESRTTWEGQGADAHQGYHQLWMTAMAEMREGLALLRGNVDVVHDNYIGAARHNTTMWP